MPIHPLPPRTQAVVPYLVMADCAKAIAFYKKVFAAEEIMRMPGPDGKSIMHAEINIAGCMIYMADEHPDCGQQSPTKLGTTTVGLTLYCLDANKVFERAVKAGAKSSRPMQDMFWGDRMGTVIDPFGHHWTLMQRVEELTPKQVMERSKLAMANA
ncbi:VOC family protein [bacterium]|nr:VOC family protein [bacterium]